MIVIFLGCMNETSLIIADVQAVIWESIYVSYIRDMAGATVALVRSVTLTPERRLK
jgi:hypothetical protein